MLPFAGFLGLLLFAFSGWALLDLALTKKEDVRILYKPIWWVGLFLGGPAGALAWTVFGRPANAGFMPGGRKAQLDDKEGEESREAPPTLRSALTAAPLGPEDSPEWAAYIADTPSDVLVAEQDPEVSADFADWESEFDEGRSDDDI